MATYTVTTLIDEDDAGASVALPGGTGLSLREAIGLANGNAGMDTIAFASGMGEAFEGGGTIYLSQGTQLFISDDITIDGDVDGDNAPDVTIDANSAIGMDDAQDRILTVSGAATANFDSLVLTGGDKTGFPAANGRGGAIYVGSNTTVNISNSIITGNDAQIGGAIGMFLVLDPTATVNVTDSVITDNYAGYFGGGISVQSAGATIINLTNSTVSGNSTGAPGTGLNQGDGGGLFLLGGDLELNNSTVSGNTATGNGGGLYLQAATVALNNSIVLGNTAASDAEFGVAGTTLSNNYSIVSGDKNLVFAEIDGTTGGGLLADNAGPVPTIALLDSGTNPAIDASGAGYTGADARGFGIYNTDEPDLHGIGRDVGAYELQIASSLVVDTKDDVIDALDGMVSLREAITFANTRVDADGDGQTNDTITFDPDVFIGGLPIYLTHAGGSELNISSDITIDGSTSAENVAISGDFTTRVFQVSFGNAVLENLTIRNGYTTDEGAGVLVGSGASATINNSLVINSYSHGYGGGGIASSGDLTITNSTIRGNYAEYDGGGIFAEDGTLTIMNSTINGNFLHNGNGGGIFIDAGVTANLTNTTIAGNTADAYGGGIDNHGSTTLNNSTVSGNYATYSGGIENKQTLTLSNSIVLGNNAFLSDDLFGGFGGNGLNIVGGSGPYVAPSDVFASIDTFSPSGNGGRLADNGGPVQTIALLADAMNPALDASDDGAPAMDARGVARFNQIGIGGEGPEFADLGAFELQEFPSLVVTTTMDVVDPSDGLTSLREAIAFANDIFAGTGLDGDADNDGFANDTITFASGMGEAFEGGGTITLGGTQLLIGSDITIEGDIDGDGTPDVTVDGDGASRVLFFAGGTSTVDGLAITGGFAGGGAGIFVDSGSTAIIANSTVSGNSAASGAGIYVYSGTATLTNTTVSDNLAQDSGGIRNFAGSTVTLTNSTVSGNDVQNEGGGIRNAGVLNVYDSTISANVAGINGGGIYNTGTTVVSNSTLDGNSAQNGGGVSAASGTLTISNSTISANTASFSGGGIQAGSASTVTLVNTTLSGNDGGSLGGGLAGPATLVNATVSGNQASFRGGGIYNFGAAATTYNSIVSGNSASAGADNYGGLITDTYTIFGGTPADIFASIDPMTGGGQLADNGGPVETIALLYSASNPAIDTGDIGAPGATLMDARGLGRVDWPMLNNDGMSFLDLGAFEVQGSDVPSLHVTTNADVVDGFDGLTSLREAITFANFVGDADGDGMANDTITFADGMGEAFEGGGGITLAMGELLVTSDVTIAGDLDGDNAPDVTISGNSVSRIFNIESGTTVVEGLIITNGDENEGGGVYVDEGATFEALDSTISNNDATYGGGLYADTGATVLLDNVTMTGNDADNYGGAIYADGAMVTILNSTIQDNYAADQGGGIQATDGSALTITNTLLDLNIADDQTGGGLHLRNGSTASLNDSTVSNNTAGEHGGGIYVTGDSMATVTNSTVSGNTAEFTGGGIYNNGQVTITGSTIADNSVNAGEGGGIISKSGSLLTITDSTLADNGSFGTGGGLDATQTILLMNNVTVSGNSSYIGGGGIYSYDSNNTLNNVTIANNSSNGAGGGLHVYEGSTYVTNSTVSGNNADGQTGGILAEFGSFQITNSIVLGNTALSNPEFHATLAYSSTYSIIGGPAPANVFAAIDGSSPSGIGGLLADNGGPVETIALLGSESNPALDAGDDGAAPANDARALGRVDLPGIANNMGNAADLGAFEHQGPVNVTPDAPLTNEVTTDEDTPSDPVPIGSSDANDDDLIYSVKSTAQPEKGVVSFVGDSFVYTPNDNANGEDLFILNIDDGNGAVIQQVVYVTINPVEDLPLAGDDAFSTIQDTVLEISQAELHANDFDGDGDTLAVTEVFGASGGTVSYSGNLAVFTPFDGFTGEGGFDYRITDGKGNFDVAHVTVDVLPIEEAPNEAPQVDPVQSIVTLIDIPVVLTIEAFDPEGDPISFSAGAPDDGDLSGSDGEYVYTPDSGFTGTDVFSFIVADDQGNEAIQNVSVSVINIAGDPDWSLLTMPGFSGTIGGTGDVFAADGFQYITVLDQPGTVEFRAGFGDDGDWVRLPGPAADWSVVRDGSDGVFSDGDTFALLPAGLGGTVVAFDDGARLFGVDSGEIVIGDQVLTDILTPLDIPPDGTLLPPPTDQASRAGLIMFPGGSVVAGGDLDITGTNAGEDVTLLFGVADADPSFNRGNDRFEIDDPAADASATRVESNVVIVTPDSRVELPFGPGGLDLEFDGAMLPLTYDPGLDLLLIGAQEIGTSSTPLTFA